MNIILFIAILALLILAHEGGHFWAAKRAGVYVHEFGIGFPPRLFAWRKGETEYSVNLLPFGGFVRIAGEDGSTASTHSTGSTSSLQASSGQARSPQGGTDENDIPPERNFVNQPLVTKLGIVLAGVAANWLLAALLLGALQTAGAPIAVPDDEAVTSAQVTITNVADGSPAEEAGIIPGDTVRELSSGAETLIPSRISDVQSFIEQHTGEAMGILVSRGEETRALTVVPRTDPPEGEGALGVALARVAHVRYPWYEAPWRGVFASLSLTVTLVEGFGETIGTFVREGRAVEGLAGPVGIAYLTGEVRSLGLLFLMNFVALLSLNLAVLNVIPFPALDGGRAAVALIEQVRGRAISSRILGRVHAAGFALLIFLLLAITVRDIQTYIL